MSDGPAPREAVAITLDCDRAVNFAMQQNDVPIVRQVRITNLTGEPITDLHIKISTELGLFPDCQTAVSTIPPGGTYTLGPCDVRPSATLLMGLTERIKGTIRAQVLKGDQVLAEVVEPVEMLAFDEWSGLSRSLPELLAAFVMPNHPVVGAILSDAAAWLGANTGDSSLSGYQTRNGGRVAQITQAIFKAVQGRGISYCNPPASFEATGQRIRLPDCIADEKLATCLDLTALLAGCLEQAGLFPLVLLTKGHAFVGVWLTEDCFPDCATDDSAQVRKRVDLNEILVFESTVLTSPPPNDFAVAVTAGKRHLADEAAFQCAIDIHRCRKSRVRPLPVRKPDGVPVPAEESAPQASAERVFDLGKTPAPITPSEAKETAATRLDKWKRKLLDLTLHNKLVNFKQTKSTIPLLCPNVSALEDALSDGLEFQLLPCPAEFGAETVRSTELHRLRTGTDPLSQLLQSEFESRRLHANLDEDELRTRVTGVYRTARTAMEEGGASALYLALGFLAWYETESSEQRRLAPLVLIPVEVRRHSVQEGFRICQSDEEPRLNITLLELLAQDFDLQLPSMDPIPEDDHGIDLQGIFATFRHAIKDMRRWDVVEEAHVGFFSFTKFLMWRDLEQRTAELLKNKVVDHLVNHPNESFPQDGDFPQETELDTKYRLQETFCPVPADSSQLAAVHTAAADKSFVLFGPPGTGKSQTITNIISHCLATGKSVLFVSEKMAALNVVFTRLSKCGLGPFCLELHSNKTHKRHVIEQLGEALDINGDRPPEDWEREAGRLAVLRSDLNAYVEALHQRRSFGESVFQVTSRLIGLRNVRAIDLGLSSPATISREQADRWHDLIEQMRVAGDEAGPPSSGPWSGCGIEGWSVSLQRELEAELNRLQDSCDRLESHVRQLGPRLSFGTNWNLRHFDFAERFIRFLCESPRPPASLLDEADWSAAETSINSWVAHGRKRDAARENLYQRYQEQVLTLDVDGLLAEFTRIQASWFLPRFFGARRIRKILKAHLRSQEKLDTGTLTKDLGLAVQVRNEQKQLGDANERATQLLGQYWKEGEADWDAVDRVREWSGRFRGFVQTASGGKPENADNLRKRWIVLICDGHDSLQPTGDLGQAMARYLEDYSEFLKVKQAIESRLTCAANVWAAEPKQATLGDMRARLAEWKANISRLRAWCNWRQVRRSCVEAGLQSLIRAYEADGVPTTQLREVFDRSFYQWWVEGTVERDSVLQKFFSPEHERRINQFRQLDDQFTQLTRAEVRARLAAGKPTVAGRVNESSEVGILQRQRQLRRGHMPVRQLFQRIPNLLERIKPCLLMSPISVAQYLDASHPPFDLVVFDEASQIPVWDAAGAIARGREAIIVGDPKQLPPTSFFMRTDEQDNGDETVVEDMESVLDECLSARLPQMNLRWHYRSRHESLIAFSNYYYYGNSLLTFPSPYVGMGVSYRHVPAGVYDKGKSRTNRAEADAVVAEVVRRLRDPKQAKLTIGIVTFSMAQQVLIEDLLDEARRSYPEIEPFFGEDAAEPVFIKNLENVQGDERDAILFSVCYGPDAEGRVSMNFGPLNRDGGERRLNVAITRARVEVIVFAAIKAEQIDLARTRARGAQDLKCFLDYAERGPIAISQALMLKGGDEFESPFERDVCQKVRDLGYEVHTQVGCSGYRIDLGVVDPEAQGRYLLGVECDGANYHSAKTARDRDRLRESVLRGLGWKLRRVWSSDWWANPDECIQKLKAALEQAKANRATSEPPSPDPAPELPPLEPVRVGKEAEPTTQAPSRELHQYRSCPIPRGVRDPQEFYLPSSDTVIRKLIEQVVQQEGPVHLEVVGRRVASHWGLARLGQTIRDRIDQVVRRSNVRRVSCGESVFLWAANSDPARYTSFRVPGVRDDDQRDIDEIPPEELIAAATHVLRQQISLPVADLVRETALLLGFQRMGQTIQRVVGAAIQDATARGVVVQDENGRVRLAEA